MLLTGADLSQWLPSKHFGWKCREAFDLFDTDGSGTIDAKELKVAMRYRQLSVADSLLCWLCDLTWTRPAGLLALSQRRKRSKR